MTAADLHSREPIRPGGRLDLLFEQQAGSTPGAVALIDADGDMTFAELAAAARRIAGALRGAGVEPGAAVGVRVARSRDYVASLLGVLKAGAAVVPLPPEYPVERLRGILAFARLSAVIDDGDGLLDASLHQHVLDVAEALATSRETSGTRDAGGSPDDPAFILCSSGSTGVPKMITRSHRSFFHRLEWTWRTHPYAAGEVCCQKAHMTTTHAVYELFEPLLRGLPVCIIADAQVRALETFWDIVRKRAVSRLLIVPSMLQASLDMPGFVPPDLKVLILMGEHVHPSLAARAIGAFPRSTGIHSIYGSTEASSTLVCDLRASLRDSHELPMGEPISPDIHAQVLDDHLQPVVDGSPGMLYLSGSALFSGYFRNPALTDAACVTLDGERLYRSNDRVRRTADGALHYLGRADHVVKVRGFRVDVQEIENALALHTGVSQCAVVASSAAGGDVDLVAFVAPATAQPADIYRTLKERLPGYMLPSRVVARDSLPRTSSGKIDRRKLLEECLPQDRSALPDDWVSDIERRIAEAWRSTLGHARFNRDSNFFEAGGSSLKTFSVIARLRADLSLGRGQLPDDALYRFPTIRQLATCIDDARAAGGTAATADETILVTLKSGRDAHAEPLFVIASAGGTLGAYEKLVRALGTAREVIGVRDPYLWGKRDPMSGFEAWVALYLAAIRARQPEGPYHLLGYSSAGAFAYEIARQLRKAGSEVALLALVDPLAMDRSSKRRFGYWALQARFERPAFGRLVKVAGWLRRVLPRRSRVNRRSVDGPALTEQRFTAFRQQALTNRQHILQLSALFELNSGLPLALEPHELDALAPQQFLDTFTAKVHASVPDFDTGMLQRLVVQYQLQVQTQHRYKLEPLGGALALFEPDGPYHGLLAAQIGPYVERLDAFRLAMAEPEGRAHELAMHFPIPLRPHYLSMRDDDFARGVARQLDRLMDHQEPR